MKATCKVVLVLALVLRAITAVPTVFAEESSQVSPPAVGEPNSTLPEYLKDRGTGVATSIFGTYVRRGELIIYPFFEYYKDANLEYMPKELGSDGDVDYRGRYRASEELFFLCRPSLKEVLPTITGG